MTPDNTPTEGDARTADRLESVDGRLRIVEGKLSMIEKTMIVVLGAVVLSGFGSYWSASGINSRIDGLYRLSGGLDTAAADLLADAENAYGLVLVPRIQQNGLDSCAGQVYAMPRNQEQVVLFEHPTNCTALLRLVATYATRFDFFSLPDVAAASRTTGEDPFVRVPTNVDGTVSMFVKDEAGMSFLIDRLSEDLAGEGLKSEITAALPWRGLSNVEEVIRQLLK